MPLLSALGMDLAQWPPYTSNLVFELWEVPPAAGSGTTVGAEGAAAATPTHVVRVLYNLEDLHLPGCPPGLEVQEPVGVGSDRPLWPVGFRLRIRLLPRSSRAPPALLPRCSRAPPALLPRSSRAEWVVICILLCNQSMERTMCRMMCTTSIASVTHSHTLHTCSTLLGLQPSLSKFETEVVGPFLLSASQWGEACKAEVGGLE